ncbi:MAG: hypothetical protein ACM359_07080 [Bacillota bacterium]
MTVDPVDFMHSLCRFVANRSGLAYAAASPQKSDLFRLAILEDYAGDPATGLLPYGGAGTSWEAVPSLSIQVATEGTSREAVLTRAQRVFESLLNDEGRPLSMIDFPGYRAADDAKDGSWRILGLRFLQRPGLIGMNAKNRPRAVFNVDCDFCRTPARG